LKTSPFKEIFVHFGQIERLARCGAWFLGDTWRFERLIALRGDKYLFVVGAARNHFANAGKMVVLMVDKPPRAVYS